MNKRIYSFAIAIVLVFCFPVSAGAVSVTDFEDVQPSDWYYDAVDYAARNGLFYGTSATMFSPNKSMTRGMFVTVLGRMADVEVTYGSTQSTPFSDVTQADYFYPYVVWANDNGIVVGVGNNRFDPHGEVTREQMAAILYRYFEKYGYELMDVSSKYDTFTDTVSVSGYAVVAMEWATTYGIINGLDGKLNPQDTATRAQVAQICLNFSYLANYAVPVDPTVPEDEDTGETVNWENYNPTYTVPTGKSAADADGGYYDYDLANEIMEQVNALRVENGLDALLYHPQIQEWASIRAMEHTIIHDYPDTPHIRPDGSNCLTVGQGLSSENLLWSKNYPTRISDIEKYATVLITAWYNSESHRMAMLSSVPNLGAISCYVKGDNVYICHLFSMRTLYYMDYLI